MEKAIKSNIWVSVFLILFLCACLSAAVMSASASGSDTVSGDAKNTADIIYGDVNGDGGIAAPDVLALRKYMADYNYDTNTSSVEVHPGADANGDGKINSSDVLLMRRYMAEYDYDSGTSSVVLGPQIPPATSAPVTTQPPADDPFENSKYAPEDYYKLYVQDGLLLHLNFATSNAKRAPLVGADPFNYNLSADQRFVGIASNYNPFVVYSKIEDPVDGGAAKIYTPWYFENWY